jgi:hypothetical protein
MDDASVAKAIDVEVDLHSDSVETKLDPFQHLWNLFVAGRDVNPVRPCSLSVRPSQDATSIQSDRAPSVSGRRGTKPLSQRSGSPTIPT